MKTKLLLLLLFYSFTSFAQVEDAWIFFKDKPQADFYLSNPSLILSSKALSRRAKFGIALNVTDAPLEKSYIQQIQLIKELNVLATSKWMNAIHVKGEVSVIQTLQNLPFVQKIEWANKSRGIQSKLISEYKYVSDRKAQKQSEDYNYGNATNQIQMLNGHLLHQQGYTGKGVDVAIFDAGFIGVNTTSPFANLRNNGQIKSTYNLVARNNNVYEADKHGTRVLSCMAAYSSGSYIGTAPDANYHLFVTEDVAKETPLEESLWVEAAEKADSLGVDIINTSLGYTTFENPAYNYTYTDMNGQTSFIARGLEQAFAKGIFCVVAAGNEGDAVWKYISTPADASHALTVGSVNSNKEYSAFSSIGPNADGIIKPDVVAQGQQVYVVNESGSVIASNGTSFAAPITCGLVACLQQAYPFMLPSELLLKIKQSAHMFNNPNFNYGYGIPDFYKVLNENLSIPLIIDEFQEFKMYPNPFTSEITIENTSKEPFCVKVYNFQGQLILGIKVEYGTAVVNTTDWQQGLYMISIENKSTKTVNKFVKN